MFHIKDSDWGNHSFNTAWEELNQARVCYFEALIYVGLPVLIIVPLVNLYVYETLARQIKACQT